MTNEMHLEMASTAFRLLVSDNMSRLFCVVPKAAELPPADRGAMFARQRMLWRGGKSTARANFRIEVWLASPLLKWTRSVVPPTSPTSPPPYEKYADGIDVREGFCPVPNVQRSCSPACQKRR
jgi:hypothetical protein